MDILNSPIFVSALMLVWGLAVRYLPQLKEWPNRLIPWMTLLIGVFAKLVAPEEAHAGVFGDLGRSLGWMVVPLESLIARQIFETWVKPTLESIGVVGYPAHALKKSEIIQGRMPNENPRRAVAAPARHHR